MQKRTARQTRMVGKERRRGKRSWEGRNSLPPSVPLTSSPSPFRSPPAPLALCSHPSSFSDAEPASSRAMSPSPRSEPASDRQEFGSPAAHHRQSQKLTTERTSLKRPPRPNISEMSANSVGDDDIDLDLPESIAPLH